MLCDPRGELLFPTSVVVAQKPFIELLGKFGHGLETVLRGFLERFQTNLIEGVINVGVECRRRLGLFLGDSSHDFQITFFFVKPSSSKQLVQTNTQGKNVGAIVNRVGQTLFGRHVSDFSFDDARACFGVLYFGFCDPKIGNFHVAMLGNQNILR